MFRTKCKEHDHSDFYRFLQMERSQKNTDCYFFYYSTCSKGDNCAFRHEPSALGCETVCSYWQQGNCLNEHCNFRHMELKKNRKAIPCYWEGQPSGCMKPHCPFLHLGRRSIINPQNPVKTTDLPSKPANQEWSNRQEDTKYDGSGTESDQGRGSSEAGSFIGSPAVDPVIVNFEEESDSESTPSPVKRPHVRVPGCKTYEEIRLEEIQAESAAYYSYEPCDYAAAVGGGKIKHVHTTRILRTVPVYSRTDLIKTNVQSSEKILNFGILTLDEIRKRRMSKNTEIQEDEFLEKKKKTSNEESDFLKNAVKTLAELKRQKKSEGGRKVNEMKKEDVIVSPKMTEMKIPPVRLKRKKCCEVVVDSFGEMKKLKTKVEVRLCDSSTNEEKNPVRPVQQACDSILDTEEDEEYLMLDATSDDILKDIDAILTDKTAVTKSW